MKQEIVNAILLGIKSTLETVTGETANLKIGKAGKNPVKVNHVTTMVGMTKDIKGHVYFTYTDVDAKALASKMMMGMEVLELNEMARSALSELQNMSMGSSCIKLEALKYDTDITPPTFMMGSGIELSGKAKKNLNLAFEINEITMGVVLSLESNN